MAKKTKETEQVQIDVKKTDEYQALLSEYERVKKELAAERSSGNIIEEAKAVASATGELRYRGISFLRYTTGTSPGFGDGYGGGDDGGPGWQSLGATKPAEITRMMRDAPKEQAGHIVREVLVEQAEKP